MNIWIVNPFDPLPGEVFRPGRYAHIANLLVNHGHRVLWWTSKWFHFSKTYRHTDSIKQTNDFSIIFIDTPPYKKNVSISRIYNHYVYGKFFKNLGMHRMDPPDIILASFPPIESAAAAVFIAKQRRCKIIIDIQDLWPDAFPTVLPNTLRPLAKQLLRPLFWKVKTLLGKVDAVMAVSNDCLDIKLGRNNKMRKDSLLLHLGIDLDAFDVPTNHEKEFMSKDSGYKWITYVGTMGKSYDLDTILITALYLKNQNNLRFILAGDGPKLERLKSFAQKNNLDNVFFTGFLKYDELKSLLIQSDIGMNTFAAGTLPFFPNKIFDYLAAGLPVINSTHGELKEVLATTESGIGYNAGNPESLVKAIRILLNDEEKRKKMAGNARRLVEERYDRNKTYPSIIPFFEKVLET